jgi:transposase
MVIFPGDPPSVVTHDLSRRPVAEASASNCSGATGEEDAKRIRRIHAEIANRCKDFLHKKSRTLADQYGLIVFGNVSSSKLAKTCMAKTCMAKTCMAKSVLDAGWAGLTSMTSYKAPMRGGMGLEVNEAWSTQTCSECDARSGPKGLEGLGIREWTCRECGTVHCRDTNSANNILRSGLATLAEGACA